MGPRRSGGTYVILNMPGRALHDEILKPGATAEAYGAYYRYIRAELFQKCGLEYEQPGEHSKRKWDAIQVPKNISHKEDLDTVLETIVVTYRMLTRHGMIVPDNLVDERRLVVGLSEKTPRGTPFRMWFYGGDTEIKITTVRQWVDRARKYVAQLPPRKEDKFLRVSEGGPSGGRR